MIILENIEQGTKEWHDARMCKVTGKKLDKVMGTLEARTGLIAELIAEEETEQSKAFKSNAEMERGTNEEPFAVKAFEEKTGKKVDRLGICVSSEFDWVSVSPDGMIKNAEGKYTEGVEVKCPDSKTMVLYRMENTIPLADIGLLTAKGEPKAGAPFLGIPAEYKWQVVQYFIVNEDLQKLYFLVYDKRFINEEAQLYIVEVNRSNEILQEAINEAREELIKFRVDWLRFKEIILPTKF
jgi:predicted phage-related endonuclease